MERVLEFIRPFFMRRPSILSAADPEEAVAEHHFELIDPLPPVRLPPSFYDIYLLLLI